MDNSQPNPIRSAGGTDSRQLRHYWQVMLERRWLIIVIFLGFVSAGFVYAFRSTPIYESVARLEIDPEGTGVLSLRDMVTIGSKDQEYLQTQYRNLQSRSLIDKVIIKLHLEGDERYKKSIDRISAVNEDIRIDPIRLTRLVEVKARHPVQSRARDMADTLLDIFLEDNQTRKSLKAMSGYRALKVEAQAQEADLTRAIQNLAEYRVRQGALSLDQDVNVVYLGYRQAKEVYEAQRARADAAEKLAEEAKGWRKSGRELADFPEVAKDQVVNQLKVTLSQTASQFAGVTNRYGPKHPTYTTLASTLANARESLDSQVQRVLKSLEATATIEKNTEAQAKGKFAEAEKEVTRLSELKVKYDVLSRQKERSEAMFQLILNKTKEYDLSSKDIVQNMTIIDHADLPSRPVKPNKPLIILASTMIGMMFALGFAFFINFLDDSVKSQDDVENFLHLQFLGYIPNIKSASVVERDLQAHLHPTSSAAEGFRTLRAAISLARNSEKLRNVAVSSTIPSEGKSLVASNFAIVTAQTGLRTLLVDADLRRPSVHKAFQLQSPVGLAAYLAERVKSVDEIVHTSDVPNLDIVCAGAAPSNPSELISSKRMHQFLEEVSSRYDRVILDCPPVSAVADPLVVGAMCDGVIFVTKFNKIRRDHALRSVQRIQDAGINLIGLVLNDIDFEGKDSYYYSYHYYQNRYYSSHYRTKPGKPEAEKGAGVAKAKG